MNHRSYKHNVEFKSLIIYFNKKRFKFKVENLKKKKYLLTL